jgi:hypothetical protein
MIEKKSTATGAHRMLNRPLRSRKAMRSTFMTFFMLGSLIALWWSVHWVAGLIVTEFGILGGLVACGVCYVTAVIMDRHGL